YDLFGRPYKATYANASTTPTAYYYYNTKGQITNEVDANGVSTLYGYNGKGERVYTVIDFDHNQTFNGNGTNRVTFTTNDVVADNGTDVRRSRVFVWGTFGLNSSNLVSMTESS